MSNIPVDTPFWEDKFNRTCGYTLFKERFTAMDVCNARFRYARKNDVQFPITFTRVDYTIINNKIKKAIGKEAFWAAVVSPTQAFFDGDWTEWAPRGEAFMEMQLCNIITSDNPLEGLSPDKKDEAKLAATTALVAAGIVKVDKKAANIIPEPIKPVKRWDNTPAPSTEDVLKALGDL